MLEIGANAGGIAGSLFGQSGSGYVGLIEDLGIVKNPLEV